MKIDTNYAVIESGYAMTSPAANTLSSIDLTAFNINPQSYLATDYLNHFNEVIMLIDMLPDMPDMLDDVLAWEPKTYPNHFAQSGFAGRDIAIAAYYQAPQAVRYGFDSVISEIDTFLLSTLSDLRRMRDEPQAMIRLARGAIADLHALVEIASGIINAAESCEIDSNDLEGHAQNTIDAVFAKA